MADLVRQSEENGNRLRTLEADSGRFRADQDQRIAALEQRMSEAAAIAAPDRNPARPSNRSGHAQAQRPPSCPRRDLVLRRRSGGAVARPAVRRRPRRGCLHARVSTCGRPASTTRRSARFGPSPPPIPSTAASVTPTISSAARCSTRATRAAPRPKLCSPIIAATRAGERAPDSLFYLGQALMKLGQPGQACKAYAELDAVYGAKVRPDLKKLEPTPKRRRSAADVLGAASVDGFPSSPVERFRAISTLLIAGRTAHRHRRSGGPDSIALLLLAARGPAGPDRGCDRRSWLPPGQPPKRPKWSRQCASGLGVSRTTWSRMGRKAGDCDQDAPAPALSPARLLGE